MSEARDKFVRQRVVREERMDDVLFLIDEEGKAIHMLEMSGIGVWTLLAESISIAEAKSVLKAAFPGVSARRIARDVEELFDDLEASGLIAHAS